MASSRISKAYHRLLTPSWCRVQEGKPQTISVGLNIIFALCAGFSCANLFYSHPILNIIAEDFNTTQSGVANIPTLAQAGEASCLLLIMPLADFFPRRHFTILLTTLATLLWLGLCLTTNLTTFLVLTYLSALFTCVVHIVIPLVSALSTPSNRAFNLSIIGLGPTLGILLARILSGVVAQYTAWRNVYWVGFAIQLCVLAALYLTMPDYPSINPTPPLRELVVRYPRILWSIVVLYAKHPVLVQACLLAFISFTSLTAFWTTLTFLLAGEPYGYGSAAIGLFGLIGAATLLLGPVFGRFVITPLRVPLYSVLVGNTLSLIGVVVGTFVGLHNVAGPVVEAVLLDAGLVVIFVANRLAIEGIEEGANNRVNTAFMIVMHLGQLVGTKAGNQVYEEYGGWVPAGLWAMGITLGGYVMVAIRGPNAKGWFGGLKSWKPVREENVEGAGEAEEHEKQANVQESKV